MKFKADMTNNDLWDAFKSAFQNDLPSTETGNNTATDVGKEHARLIKKTRKQ